MPNRRRLALIPVLAFFLIFSGKANAQDEEKTLQQYLRSGKMPATSVPGSRTDYAPQGTGQTEILPYAPNVLPPLNQISPLRQPAPPMPQPEWKGEMNLSDFERFVSGETLEITDFQFDILSRFEGIVFQHTKSKIPTGQIAIPVKVMRHDRTGNYPPELVDAGYLVGDKENIGAIFTILGIKSTYPMATELRQFGYDLFGSGPASFTPAENAPVGPEYVIGPGDEIKITVWGKIDGQWVVTVERDGTISLPELGTIGVAGLTFSELKEQLFREMSRNYTGFEMNVGLGSLRTMRVYLVGNARKPGAYTLSSLSTLVSALFETGGPAKSGSLRNLELRRNGKPVAVFDMYDFLIKGDKTKDERLLPEDVIFIPPIGKVAAIAGNVNNPAIYEIKDEKTITGLIGLAGGLNALAFEGRVQIERIVDSSRQTVFESDIAKLKDKEIPVESGDVVKIFQIVKDKKTVKLAGAVQREGDFGFSPGMTVNDLVDLAGGLQYFAYNKEAELTRVHVTDEGPKTEKIMIDLEKALAGEPESNIRLKEDDYLFIRTVPEWRLYRIVNLSGEVKFPGNYTIRKGERLSSLFERAGGFTDKAYLKGAVFLRASVQEAQQKRLTESIDRLEQHMLSSSLLETQAALSAEEVARQKTLQSQQSALLAKMRSAKPLGRLTIRLEEHIETFAGSTFDIELEEGDSIFIPDRPASVNVMGSLYNPTAFIYNPEASVSDYIEMAGGMTEEAEDDNIFVLKADGSAVSRQQGSSWGMDWNPETKRYESGTFMAKKLDAGDTIVVPPKLQTFSWLKETKDIAQILYQIAVAAGVLIVAF